MKAGVWGPSSGRLKLGYGYEYGYRLGEINKTQDPQIGQIFEN